MKLSDLPKAELTWVRQLRETSYSFRRKLVELLLDGVKEFKSKKNPDLGKQICADIRSGKMDLVGIATCQPYIKVEGDENERQMEYVHAFGMPTLLYHVKDSPVFVLINPALRFNTNILKEVEKNGYDEIVKGITS
jgi:predicted peroxiredoxin